jgi:hypothetical protein
LNPFLKDAFCLLFEKSSVRLISLLVEIIDELYAEGSIAVDDWRTILI